MKKSIAVKIIGIYVIIQLVLVLTPNAGFVGDSKMYYDLAQECVANHTFYPAQHNIHDDYIIAPLYVNFNILLLLLYNSPLIIFLGNVFLNTLCMYLLYRVSLRLFNNHSWAVMSMVLYGCYLSNLGLVVMNLTELLFLTLVLSALFCYLKYNDIKILYSGIFMGLAFAVRQESLVFLPVILILAIWEKAPFKKVLLTGAGFLVVALISVLFIHHQTGYWVVNSTTGPINVLIGANDDATGTYDHTVLEPGNIGYLARPDTMTFVEKAEFWGTTGKQWIHQHPVKWIALVPAKVAWLFLYDDWSLPALLKTNRWNLYLITKQLVANKQLSALCQQMGVEYFVLFTVSLLVHHVFYFLLLLLMVYQFRFYRKRLRWVMKKSRIIYLYSVLNIAAIMVAYGTVRYKYSMFVLMMLTIAPMVTEMVSRCRSEKKIPVA